MTIVVGTNSYINIADADTYFASSLSNSSWEALGEDVKEQSLITATRMIDRQTWSGTKTSSSQALEWPRSGVTDKYGNTVNSATIPQQIKDATCELALSLQQDASVQTNVDSGFNIKRLKADTAEIEYFRPVSGGRFPTIVNELLAQFRSGAASTVGVGGYASGTCERSVFDPNNPNNNYNTNETY